MACKYCMNGCGCCDHFVKTSKITSDGHFLSLEIPDRTYKNGELICVCLAQDIPQAEKPLRVVMSIGGSQYAVTNTLACGLFGTANYMYSDQLLRNRRDGRVRARQILNLRFSADTFLFNYVGNRRPLCRTTAKISDADFCEIRNQRPHQEEEGQEEM